MKAVTRAQNVMIKAPSTRLVNTLVKAPVVIVKLIEAEAVALIAVLAESTDATAVEFVAALEAQLADPVADAE